MIPIHSHYNNDTILKFSPSIEAGLTVAMVMTVQDNIKTDHLLYLDYSYTYAHVHGLLLHCYNRFVNYTTMALIYWCYVIGLTLCIIAGTSFYTRMCRVTFRKSEYKCLRCLERIYL